MGTANGVPRSDLPGVNTQVVDHTGEFPVSTKIYTNINKAAFDTYTIIGTPTGRWVPGINDCNTWVDTVIKNSTPHDIEFNFLGFSIPIVRNIVIYQDGSVRRPDGTKVGRIK